MTISGSRACESALGLCAAGRFDLAQPMLEEHVRRSPEDLPAWLLLAKLRLERKEYNAALEAARTAARLENRCAESFYWQGRALRAMGNLAAAERAYRAALAIDPVNADVLTSLGVLLRSSGREPEAIDSYRRALASNPGHAEARHNLGQALAAERQAVDSLIAEGRIDEARAALLNAIRASPLEAEWHLRIGKLDCAHGRAQSGLESVEAAAELERTSVEANEIARRICLSAGLHERALMYSDRVLALSPSEDVVVARRLSLPSIQQSRESIRATRDRYARGLAESLASTAPLTLPVDATRPDVFTVISHPAFYLAYHGENNRALQRDLARVFLQRIPDLAFTAEHCRHTRRGGTRLRVGFISRFLRKHSIGMTTRGLVDQLSRELFEVYVLRITPSGEDAVTAAIRAAADVSIDLHPEIRAAREQIAALELDVLFYQDIGMEPTSYYLAFSRLAPVQCVSFGHPDTTGIPNVDYFVSNDLFEPAGAEEHYSEQLFLLRDLPTLAYYYKPHAAEARLSRADFGVRADEHLYLCPQALFKLHPDFDDLLGGILARDPKAVVLLIEWTFKDVVGALRSRFQRTLPTYAQRIRFIPRMPYARFLALLGLADVILDTVHFNGMNTSLEAFAMGTPVVTLPGVLQRGRHTQAMYRKMGMTDCIATAAHDYAEIAVSIAASRERFQHLRELLLSRNHVLFENRRVVEEFARFFIEAHSRTGR